MIVWPAIVVSTRESRERYRLQEPDEADAERLHALFSEAAVTRHIPPPPSSVAAWKAWIAATRRRPAGAGVAGFAVVKRVTDDEIAGLVQIATCPDEPGALMWGLVLPKRSWGKGLFDATGASRRRHREESAPRCSASGLDRRGQRPRGQGVPQTPTSHRHSRPEHVVPRRSQGRFRDCDDEVLTHRSAAIRLQRLRPCRTVVTRSEEPERRRSEAPRPPARARRFRPPRTAGPEPSPASDRQAHGHLPPPLACSVGQSREGADDHDGETEGGAQGERAGIETRSREASES